MREFESGFDPQRTFVMLGSALLKSGFRASATKKCTNDQAYPYGVKAGAHQLPRPLEPLERLSAHLGDKRRAVDRLQSFNSSGCNINL